jgi:hypothetical protein
MSSNQIVEATSGVPLLPEVLFENLPWKLDLHWVSEVLG